MRVPLIGCATQCAGLLLETSMRGKLLTSLASEHIYFSCFHQWRVFCVHGMGSDPGPCEPQWVQGCEDGSWDGEVKAPESYSVTSCLSRYLWISDFLPPKVTLKCDLPAQGFVESGWKNTCLVSWSLCLFLSYSRAWVTAHPWLHPSATWTRGHSWPCWCWTMQPARFPPLPRDRPVFTCCIAHITTWHHLVRFLLSYRPLCLPMPHARLCAPWGPHWSWSAMSEVPSMALWLWKCLGYQQVVSSASRPPHLDLLTAEIGGDWGGATQGEGHWGLSRWSRSPVCGRRPGRKARPYDGVQGGYQGGSYRNWSELPISF